MTDIVSRLRKPLDGMPSGFYRECGELRREAADEIERLLAKNRQLASTLATRLLEPKAADEIERLHAMLSWMDDHDPQLVALARSISRYAKDRPKQT